MFVISDQLQDPEWKQKCVAHQENYIRAQWQMVIITIMKKETISKKLSSKSHFSTWTVGVLIVSITLFHFGFSWWSTIFEQYSGRLQVVTEITAGKVDWEIGHSTITYYGNKVRYIYFIGQFEFITGCS